MIERVSRKGGVGVGIERWSNHAGKQGGGKEGGIKDVRIKNYIHLNG